MLHYKNPSFPVADWAPALVMKVSTLLEQVTVIIYLKFGMDSRIPSLSYGEPIRATCM